MYKVVIIDDEPIIVEGLSKLLPWEQYHCRIAATACNGKEGLEVIRRERSDILFQISAETIQYDGAGRSVKGDDRVPEKKRNNRRRTSTGRFVGYRQFCCEECTSVHRRTLQ